MFSYCGKHKKNVAGRIRECTVITALTNQTI